MNAQPRFKGQLRRAKGKRLSPAVATEVLADSTDQVKDGA